MYVLKRIKPDQDCDQLYELIRIHGGFSVLPQQPIFINKEDFRHWILGQLSGYYHDFFMIKDTSRTESSNICGWLLAYDYRIYDGHCKFYGYLCQGLNKMITSQFLNILFKEYPLKKVFLQITNADTSLLSVAYELGFKQEAILYEYKYSWGNYKDLLILSVYPKNLLER